MLTYKLTYFNLTGLGEPIRFLLSYAGVNFEDNRVSFEDWPKVKPTMPMGQMPILEIDGKVYHQSRAICRFLAKKFSLYGSNDLEALEIDSSVDDIDDLRAVAAKVFPEKDPAQKAIIRAAAAEKAPFFLDKFEKQVKSNGGHFVGNKLTYADIYFTTIIDVISHFLEKDLLKDYPALKKLHDDVLSNPKIKAYVDKRPKTVF